MKFYAVYFDDGGFYHDYFESYNACLDYAEKIGGEFIIEEYENEESYFQNL